MNIKHSRVIVLGSNNVAKLWWSSGLKFSNTYVSELSGKYYGPMTSGFTESQSHILAGNIGDRNYAYPLVRRKSTGIFTTIESLSLDPSNIETSAATNTNSVIASGGDNIYLIDGNLSWSNPGRINNPDDAYHWFNVTASDDRIFVHGGSDDSSSPHETWLRTVLSNGMQGPQMNTGLQGFGTVIGTLNGNIILLGVFYGEFLVYDKNGTQIINTRVSMYQRQNWAGSSTQMRQCGNRIGLKASEWKKAAIIDSNFTVTELDTTSYGYSVNIDGKLVLYDDASRMGSVVQLEAYDTNLIRGSVELDATGFNTTYIMNLYESLAGNLYCYTYLNNSQGIVYSA